jgi:formylglycine-generating enzyme required for sulfatase activity
MRTKNIRLLFSLLFTTSLVFAQNDFSSYDQDIPGSQLKYKMIPIRGGEFLMGSAEGEKNRKKDEGPQRTVTVSSFWMGAFEVTHDQFDIFFKDETIPVNSRVDAVTRPTAQYIDLSWGMGRGGGYPVNSMSQGAAIMFCKWLYQKTGLFYRLPTEAEWEYACRAGSTTPYSFGGNENELDQYAWFKENSGNKYHKVGQKKPNAFGLYDMMGNVSEWTMDQYDSSYFTKLANGASDPANPPLSRYPKTLKGGSFLTDKADLRSANRLKSEARWNRRDPQIPKSRWWLTDAMDAGFRIVRPLKQPSQEEAKEYYALYLTDF